MANEGFHKIRSLEVDEGFLRDLRVEFSDHLNCVIGSRGAGKTTLLEFLRFALAIDPGSEARRKELGSLVSKNLRSGRVRLEVETQQGLRYTIERKSGEDAQVFNDAGEAVALSLEGGPLFGAQVYSQSEIEEIATTAADKLQLVDRFAEEDLSELELEFRTVERKLTRSAAELVGLAGEVEDLARDLDTQLRGVVEELRAFEQAGSSADQEVKDALSAKANRESDRRALSGLTERLQADREQLEALSKDLVGRLADLLPAESLGGTSRELFNELQSELGRYQTELAYAFSRATSAAEAFLLQARTSEGELDTEHREQEAAFEALLKQHQEAQEGAQRRIKSQRRHAELVARSREHKSKHQAFLEKKETRRLLTRRLSELREDRSRLRERVIQKLNADLDGTGIKISFKRAQDRTRYQRLLSEAFRGTKRRGQADLVKRIVRIPPRDFARMVSTRNVEELADQMDLDRDDAAWIVGQLRDTPDLYEIEVVELADEPTIHFKDGEEWKESGDLSTGQKFTAVLPILLLHSEKPLICDEPESHLDQATLVEKVVSQIRNMRGRRQLIFATHNPNIPVLGDVGETQILVLESSGTQARISKGGSVDDTKEDIERLLEGGEDAFRERARRYGLGGD